MNLRGGGGLADGGPGVSVNGAVVPAPANETDITLGNGSSLPSPTISPAFVYLFTGEGAHASDTDVVELQRSPAWPRLEAVAPMLLGQE